MTNDKKTHDNRINIQLAKKEVCLTFSKLLASQVGNRFTQLLLSLAVMVAKKKKGDNSI